MSVNIIEVMDSVVADAQSLSHELGQNEQAQQRIEQLLNAAQFIQTELKMYISSDGSVSKTIRESGRYAAAPFAIFETGIYLTKKLNAAGTITLSNLELERLEIMNTKVAHVKKHLDQIWGIE